MSHLPFLNYTYWGHSGCICDGLTRDDWLKEEDPPWMCTVYHMGRRFQWKKRKKASRVPAPLPPGAAGCEVSYPGMSFLCWRMESSDISRINPSSPISCPQQVVPIKCFGHSNENGASYFLSMVWAEDSCPTSIQVMKSKTVGGSHLSVSRTHTFVSVSAFKGAAQLDQGAMC